jgi:NAD(P)-dependent dehydrogenase (short-subunit alcohol dehydrogenase family)
MARSLAAAGATVQLHGSDEPEIRAQVAKLAAEGYPADYITGELSAPAEVRRVAEAAMSKGSVDTLLMCASASSSVSHSIPATGRPGCFHDEHGHC